MKQKPTISVTEIRRQLASLKEEVAAPRAFRASIMKRLAEETGQKAPETKASAWSRMIDFVKTPVLAPALGGAAALAIGLWIAAPAPREIPVEAPAQVAAVKAAVGRAGGPPLRSIKKHSAQVAQLKPATVETLPVTETQAAEQPAPALGGSAGSNGGSQSSQSSGGVSAAGSTTPSVDPTSAPSGGPLQGDSQVRRNKFQASKGEYAAIVFKLKAPGKARIEIYNRMGSLVAVPHDAEQGAGTFEVRWRGHDDSGQLAPTGIYLARIITGEYTASHKIVLVR